MTAVVRECEGCEATGRGGAMGTVRRVELVSAVVVEGPRGVAEGMSVTLDAVTTATSQRNERDGGARLIFAMNRPARMMAVPCRHRETSQPPARRRTNASGSAGCWAVTGGRPPGLRTEIQGREFHPPR